MNIPTPRPRSQLLFVAVIHRLPISHFSTDTSTASQDSTEVKRIDLLVSPFQSRSQKLYFCKHVLANEHQKGVCPYLMPGWIGSFEEPHQDDTLGMLLDRINDPRGKQHVSAVG